MKNLEKSKLEDLNKAVAVLKNGGVVVFPTDTVYGIGCKWNNNTAIARIRHIKSSNQNFPILVANIKQAHEIGKISPQALHLINRYWPGGLTVLVKSRSSDQKIGIRMPASETVKYLVENTGCPIIGTSANLHEQPSPTSSKELDPKIVNLADFVINGECEEGVESTVIDSTVMPIKIIRSGAVNLT
jgi:L-threonylcarbamoyladenylate synthase